MTKNELAELMDYISAVDNRNVTTEKLKAWYEIIGYLDFETAKTATVMAQREPGVSYIEPKHIVAFAAKVKEQRQTEQRRQEAMTDKPQFKGSPMPKCHHGIGLLSCDPCCRQAAIQAGLIS